MKTRVIMALLLIFAFSSGGYLGAESSKREFRGAWFPTVVNTTWRSMTTQEIKEDIIFYLNLFKDLNMNAVIFQVRPQADALFESKLEPWSRFLTGKQGVAPDPYFDPTLFIIEECHKRGMELHAWFNLYRVTSNSKEVLAQEHLFFKKPELFINYGDQIYFDPGNPGSREHTIRVIKDFVSRYDADAIHFDDYFYPYKLPYREFGDQRSFEKFRDGDGFGEFDKDNWRRNNVNLLVKELSEVIKSIKPWVKFGISPFGVWRNRAVDPSGSDSHALQTNYDDLYADILLWMQKGWIDYVAPQLYWEIGHSRADYLPLIKWWSENSFDVNLYIGQSIWSQIGIKNRYGDYVNQMHRKMKLVREDKNIGGNIWWSGLGLSNLDSVRDSLMLEYQKHPSLVPLYSKIDTIPPKPVQSLTFKRGLLKWSSPPEEDPLNIHHLYVVYRFEKGESPNLNRSDRIIEIGRFTSLKVAKRKGVTYAVTALDRLQNESDAVYITL